MVLKKKSEDSFVERLISAPINTLRNYFWILIDFILIDILDTELNWSNSNLAYPIEVDISRSIDDNYFNSKLFNFIQNLLKL